MGDRAGTVEDVGVDVTLAGDVAFWRGRRVLVTGHTGFKGAWLCTWLLELGARVQGYALPPETDPNLFGVLGLDRELEHQLGDIRDFDAVSAAFRKGKPEVVLHMAAQPLVRESYRDPVATYDTNVMGTVHVLEACRMTDTVTVIVVVTSDKCYENREWVWGYRETDRLGGRDPYSSSKASAELVTAAYRASFFDRRSTSGAHVSVSTARAGNVIGGGDWTADRLVPDAIKSFAASQPLIVRNPTATRPWQHVIDPLRGYLLLCERAQRRADPITGAFNFGPADADIATTAELAGRLADEWGPEAAWEPRLQPDQPHEAGNLRLDSSRARQVLGWRPVFGLESAVRETVRWYRAYYDHAGAAELRELMVNAFRHTEAAP